MESREKAEAAIYALFCLVAIFLLYYKQDQMVVMGTLIIGILW